MVTLRRESPPKTGFTRSPYFFLIAVLLVCLALTSLGLGLS